MQVFFVIFFLLIISCDLSSQVRKNLEILDSLSSNIFLNLYRKSGCKPQLNLEMIEVPAYASYLKTRFDEVSLKFAYDIECDDKVKYFGYDQEINYLPYSKNSQRFIREIKITLAGTDSLGLRKVFTDSYNDILSYSDLQNIETKEVIYSYGKNKVGNELAQSLIPQSERTMWQKVAEPSILGIISGAIVYLFFSVRSK